MTGSVNQVGQTGKQVQEIHTTFPCGALTLEGVLRIPPSLEPVPAVVVCHPHPLYGGNMQNNVVMAVVRGLAAQGWATLRFNFRGAGRSEGHYDHGRGEQADTRAAISYLETRNEIDPGRIGLCGYSFGSMVAFPVAATDNRVRAVAGISPPSPPNDLANYAGPKLFLWGDKDTMINTKATAHVFPTLSEPKILEVIAGADHFWGGQEEVITKIIGEFFRNYL
jgi:alpha/beta superfamily hydrolase